MKTIFLQISDIQYRNLIDALALAHNETAHMATITSDNIDKQLLVSQTQDIMELMSTIGEQGQSQL